MANANPEPHEIDPPAAPPGDVAPDSIQAFVINLEKDVDRRNGLLGQFAALPHVQPTIVEAIHGSALSDGVCEGLVQQKRWAKNKGTIGCFLSHAKAWEAVSRISDRFAVVLEDDVDIGGLKHLPSLDVPVDADIVFINDRMSPAENRGKPTALPIAHALRRLEQTHSGPGGDGYLLTPAGAGKLLAACLKDFYFGHVDGRLLRYATTEQDLATMPDNSWIVEVVRHHRHPTLVPTLGLLKGYCVSMPLVRHLGVTSIREAEDGKTTRDAPLPRRAGSPFDRRLDEETAGLPIRYWTFANNAGDKINPYIFEAAASRTAYFSARPAQPHVLGVGSILFMATPESHIWGSGILDPTADYGQVSASKVHAVRGKLTREILRARHGLKKDVALGDPGVFADEIPEIVQYVKSSRIKRRIGVIPHHRMVGHPYIRDITRHADAYVIDPRLDCLDFIREIISSEIIISQSLHGLIFAQVFGKPFAWFSHTLEDTWLFKFRDWFSTSIDAPAAPAVFGSSLDTLLRTARKSGVAIDKAALREVVPQLATGNHRPGMSFRELRRLAPLAFRVAHDPRAPVSPGYSATITCDKGDEATLQNALNAHARRCDDSFRLWLVFDEAVFASLTIGDMHRYEALLDELPDVHYLTILPAEARVPGQESLRVQAGDGAQLVEANHPSYGWQGVALVRSPHEFSFSARGSAIFRETRSGLQAARAA